MKAVILAGGLGTRFGEETDVRPKPMIEIGGKPILWHIMKIYSAHGINDFIICCGYKGYIIKEYFANYFVHQSDVTFDMQNNKMLIHKQRVEPWSVSLIDTGETSMTGGRLKRLSDFLRDEQAFCFTYGDGVANVDISALIAFHHSHGKSATLTAVNPPARFGALEIVSGRVNKFIEKPASETGLINGGFFVLSPTVLDRIEDDQTVWEDAPLSSLATDGELMAYAHDGFWQPMDTLRDKRSLQQLWDNGQAPWKVWD